MSITRTILAAEGRTLSWKNGGGETREIAIAPPSAGIEDFDWRFSAAKLDRDGPFSAFPGVQRKLAVTEGRLRLSGPGTDLILDCASPPVTFDGAAPFIGEPLGPSASALNAMVRAGRYDCTMERLSAGDVARGTGSCFLFALEPQLLEGMTLQAFDCAEFAVSLQLGGKAILVTFSERIQPRYPIAELFSSPWKPGRMS